MKQPRIHTLLLRCFHAQRAALYPAITQAGLSPGQPKILRYLAANDGCSQKDLAVHCDIEPATVSKVLSGMEDNGLIRRASCPRDKRSISVHLTEKGLEAERIMAAHFDALNARELDGFSPQEIAELTDYLKRVYRNLTGNAYR
jgi:DNA-binding MarR family transcriptional regulator